ncbi:hypothetical protein PVAND_007864 [Polypedilum vanderplanki]|uniref:Uncharacterized protein n=1 Tax=Polypedilum vanderplanki TaxID=319348 RepID=A0A9J6C8Q8_POLVA|nr:hypothetical protein PVAND_007864 [Polypedilum vanderplanki]
MVKLKCKKECKKSFKNCDKYRRPATPPAKKVSFSYITCNDECCDKVKYECKEIKCGEPCLKPGCSVRMPCLSCTRRGVKMKIPCRSKTTICCEESCARKYCCPRKSTELYCGDCSILKSACKQQTQKCTPVKVCVKDNSECPTDPCCEQQVTVVPTEECQPVTCSPQRKISKCCCELCKRAEAKCKSARCCSRGRLTKAGCCCCKICIYKREIPCGRICKKLTDDCGSDEEISCEPFPVIPMSTLRSVGSFIVPTICNKPQRCFRSSNCSNSNASLMFQQAFQSPSTCTTVQYLP